MAAKTKEIAQELQKFGRFGDSELVHLNPAEVDMLASMSPTGELTTNPDTGLKEAFLPFLAGLLPSLMGTGGILSAIPGAAAIAAHPLLAGAGLGALGSLIQGDNPLEGALQGGVGAGIGKMMGPKGPTKGVSIGDKFSQNLSQLGGDVTTAIPGNGIAPAIADAAPAMMPPSAGGGAMGWLGKHPGLAALGVGALSGMGGGQKMPKAAPHEYVPEAYFTRQPMGIDIGRVNWDNYGSDGEYDLIDNADPGYQSISYR